MPKGIIENIGPIRSIEFDLPDDAGGVLVFLGENTRGKSTAIKALSGLLRGSGKLAVRDGMRKGLVDAFGAKASVTPARTTHNGELEVESIEEAFSFSDLVRTQGKEPATRDKTRVKTLLQLTGAKADPSLFYDLAGGKEALEQLVTAKDLITDDLVELAGKVHRGLHAAKRKLVESAEHAEGSATACEKMAAESPPCDLDLETCQRESEKAAADLQRMQDAVTAGAERDANLTLLREKLEKAKAEQKGPTTEEAGRVVDAKVEYYDVCLAQVASLRKQLADAEQALKEALAAKSSACDVLMMAARSGEALNAITDEIDRQASLAIEVPSEFELCLAKDNLEVRRQKVQDATLARDASKKRDEAKEHKAKAKELRAKAEKFEDAAKAVDGVLSSCLPEGPLKWKDEQLVLTTSRGEDVPFDECSSGEMVKTCLPYGIRQIGSNGVIPLIQDAWQDLDKKARREIAEMCEQMKVWIITGQVEEGELRPEVYKP